MTTSAPTATAEAILSRPRAQLRSSPEKARMLLIVNPKATTVSSRLKNLIVYALRARYEVEAVETEGRNHATQITRNATHEGYDLVVAFGGDGTVNETAHGLAGSDTPLALLPGGSTNVVCRMLGMPTDVIDATEHLLSLSDDLAARRVDLGVVNGRHFVASAGVGVDADTTRWVDQHPPLKSRAGPFFFSYAALMSFYGYAGKPGRIAIEVDGNRLEGATAVVQNSDPYTYFRSRPIRVCEGAALDSGSLSLVVLEQARHRDVPTLAWKLLTRRSPVSRHSSVRSFRDVTTVKMTALAENGEPLPFPLQVDGDYLDRYTDATFEIRPASLLVVA